MLSESSEMDGKFSQFLHLSFCNFWSHEKQDGVISIIPDIEVYLHSKRHKANKKFLVHRNNAFFSVFLQVRILVMNQEFLVNPEYSERE